MPIEPSSVIDEKHPDFTLLRDALAVSGAMAAEYGPNEARGVLCGFVAAGALLLEGAGIMDRRASGTMLAVVVQNTQAHDADGSGTLAALQRVADLLAGRNSEGEADAPHG